MGIIIEFVKLTEKNQFHYGNIIFIPTSQNTSFCDIGKLYVFPQSSHKRFLCDAFFFLFIGIILIMRLRSGGPPLPSIRRISPCYLKYQIYQPLPPFFVSQLPPFQGRAGRPRFTRTPLLFWLPFSYLLDSLTCTPPHAILHYQGVRRRLPLIATYYVPFNGGNLPPAVTHCQFCITCQSPRIGHPPLALYSPIGRSYFYCSLIDICRSLFFAVLGAGGSEASKTNILPIFLFFRQSQAQKIFENSFLSNLSLKYQISKRNLPMRICLQIFKTILYL